MTMRRFSAQFFGDPRRENRSTSFGAIDYEAPSESAARQMKTTRYFDEQVLRKRPYIKPDWCEATLRTRIRREMQPDGRMRYWRLISDTPTVNLLYCVS
jgi:hypothetical protein